MVCGGFSLIARCFDRVRTSRLDVEIGTGDDRAFLNILEEQTLAISTDTLTAGNHSLPGIDPTDLAWKALAADSSDLAAVGADPTWLTLAFTLPDVDEAWLEAFSDGLFELLNYHNIQLIGGDTMRGSLSMTLGVRGYVLVGWTLRCLGMRPGDWIYATGMPGDSAAGLATLQNRLQVADTTDADYLLQRHLCPTPCVLQGQALHDLASTTIDLPDGLISDLGCIVNASGYGARVNVDVLSYSTALSQHVEPEQALCWALSGDEGYESYFTVPEINRGALEVALGNFGAAFTCIGQMSVDVEGVYFTRDGKPVTFDWKGYDHSAAPQKRCR